ncbi:hypothetical protein Dsin_032358 [Dipteronia sinensis]|uniref:RNase H type-1 domain-containing protein n=1 Tax=Dipteronia sinensis TaxID=43782 RepID=A0AAE0DT99_9ROSI|nr:hypothetical protein Dsin_032358 [Dipteronia sinensis]
MDGSGGRQQDGVEASGPVITCATEADMVAVMDGDENVVEEVGEGEPGKGKGISLPKYTARKWRRAARLASSHRGSLLGRPLGVPEGKGPLELIRKRLAIVQEAVREGSELQFCLEGRVVEALIEFACPSESQSFSMEDVEKVWEVTEFGLLLGELKGLGCLEILCWFSLQFDREAMARFAMWSGQGGLASPPSGGLKLNTDAVVPLVGNSFGIGAVIRDFAGKVVLALSKIVQGCFSIEVCEALALRKGLSLAKQHGLIIGWAKLTNR